MKIESIRLKYYLKLNKNRHESKRGTWHCLRTNSKWIPVVQSALTQHYQRFKFRSSTPSNQIDADFLAVRFHWRPIIRWFPVTINPQRFTFFLFQVYGLKELIKKKKGLLVFFFFSFLWVEKKVIGLEYAFRRSFTLLI